MSLLFLNGLMPERHGQLIRTLGRGHVLAGTRLESLAGDPDLRIIDYLDERRLAASPLLADLEANLAAQTRVLAGSLSADLAAIARGAQPAAPLDEPEIAEAVRPRVARLLMDELRFLAFVQEHPVDMVLSGSDFGSHSRVVARTARRLGIPTLDIEHGFFFSRLAGAWCRVRGRMPLLFTSAFVNVDNELEKQLLEHEQAQFPRHHADEEVQFLALGTPIDTVASQGVPRLEAIHALGLDPERVQVLVGSSWIEARYVQMLLGAQVDTMDAWEDLFASLARTDFRHRLQLTIKLHPADCRPDVLPHVTSALESMARGHGLEPPLILSEALADALSACDVLLTMSFTSILYDAFLLGKPSVAIVPRYLRPGDGQDWRLNCTLPLQARVCEATTDGADAWRRVESWLEPGRQEQFARDREAFSRKYGLKDRPVQDKCEAILAWVEAQLSAR